MKNFNIISEYKINTEMRAIAMTRKPKIGHVVEEIKMIKVPVPIAKEGEVVIKMVASSLYADELYAAQGTALGRFFGPKEVTEEKPYIMGSSVAGVIVSLGENVRELYIGQEVITIPSQTPTHGVWAEYCCIDQDRVIQKPKEFSFIESVGLKMAACVSWGAICHTDIKVGDRCVVIGASGGLGIMAVQYLKSLGAHVTGVCSGRNAEMVLTYGADEIVDYTKENFGERAVLNKEYYDNVFDFVGGVEGEKSGVQSLKQSGRYVTVTGPEKFIGEKKLSWGQLIRIFWHVLYKFTLSHISGPRYIWGEMKPSKTIHSALDQAIKHNIKMPISQIIPFEVGAVKEALNLLLQHRAKGRIVIDWRKQDTI